MLCIAFGAAAVARAALRQSLLEALVELLLPATGSGASTTADARVREGGRDARAPRGAVERDQRRQREPGPGHGSSSGRR